MSTLPHEAVESHPARRGAGRRVRALAAAGVVLVLVVVLASAALRQGAEAFSPAVLSALRAVHRAAASLEALVVLALLWLAWRSRLVLAIAGITLLLSVVGVLAGRNPPAAAALANLLGGLALAGCFAALVRETTQREDESPVLTLLVAGVVAAQCVLGALVAIVVKDFLSLTFLIHALVGMVLCAYLAWRALRVDAPAVRLSLVLLAVAAPAAGLVAALFGFSSSSRGLSSPVAPALAHAALVALLVVAAALAREKRA